MPVNIYEAWNQPLKEILIGLTRLSVSELRAFHRKNPPRPAAHWDFNVHRIDYVEVERGLPDEDAPAFIEHYAIATPAKGWRRLLDESLPGR